MPISPNRARDSRNVSSSSIRLRERALAFLVGALDRLLQRCYRIEEFTQQADCLLRVSLRHVGKAIHLHDGTHIGPDELVGELHLWNEHLPRFPPAGPTFQWARRMRHRTIRSLHLLAEHMQREPAWGRVQAFYADVPVRRRRGFSELQRLARRYGFECVPQQRSIIRSMREIAESLLLWGLAIVHNPAALGRQLTVRRRQQIWISRTGLLQRYGTAQDRCVATRPSDREKVQ